MSLIVEWRKREQCLLRNSQLFNFHFILPSGPKSIALFFYRHRFSSQIILYFHTIPPVYFLMQIHFGFKNLRFLSSIFFRRTESHLHRLLFHAPSTSHKRAFYRNHIIFRFMCKCCCRCCCWMLALYQFADIFHRHGIETGNERAFEYFFSCLIPSVSFLFSSTIPPIASMLLMLFLLRFLLLLLLSYTHFHILLLMLFIVQSLFWYSNFEHFATMDWIIFSLFLFTSSSSLCFLASDEHQTENIFIFVFEFVHAFASHWFFGPFGNIDSQEQQQQLREEKKYSKEIKLHWINLIELEIITISIC